MSTPTDCPFCPLEAKTTWHHVIELEDGEKAVICDDLNAKGHKHRLLCVISNRHDPDPWPALLGGIIMQKAEEIAEDLKRDIRWKEASWDSQMQNEEHYHLQLVLD